MPQHDAPPRYCPSCGGPNPTAGAIACRFCEGPLIPVGTADPRTALRCPRCAVSVAAGASFCPACGTGLATAATAPSVHTCPGCGDSPMTRYGLSPSPQSPAGNPVDGCRRCGGVWIDASTLQTLLQAASAQAIVDDHTRGPGAVQRRKMATTQVVYRQCAVCNQHMQRKNFARVSGVVVDQCRAHGSFFDAGELEDVLNFVRSGGLRMAAQRDAEEQARHARHRAAVARPNPMAGRAPSTFGDGDPVGADPIGAFVAWVLRWVAR